MIDVGVDFVTINELAHTACSSTVRKVSTVYAIAFARVHSLDVAMLMCIGAYSFAHFITCLLYTSDAADE